MLRTLFLKYIDIDGIIVMEFAKHSVKGTATVALCNKYLFWYLDPLNLRKTWSKNQVGPRGGSSMKARPPTAPERCRASESP